MGCVFGFVFRFALLSLVLFLLVLGCLGCFSGCSTHGSLAQRPTQPIHPPQPRVFLRGFLCKIIGPTTFTRPMLWYNYLPKAPIQKPSLSSLSLSHTSKPHFTVMATTAAAATTIARSILTVRSSSLSYLRFLSSASSSLSRAPPLPGFARPTRPTFLLSHSIRVVAPGAAARLTAIRCRVNRPGGSAYSPLNSGSNFSDRPPTEMAPLFPGCDYEHWLIVMDKPGGEGATKEQMIDCYVQTLAKVLGR